MKAKCSSSRFGLSDADTISAVRTPVSAAVTDSVSENEAWTAMARGNSGAREGSRASRRWPTPAAANVRATLPPSRPVAPVMPNGARSAVMQPSCRADSAAALGNDPIPRLLARNSVQTTLSVATYGVYALTNAFFVSRWVGPVALASVNVAAPLLMIIGAVVTTIGTGGASVLSRALGGGDLTRAARATGTSLGAYWILSTVLGILGIVFLDPLVHLLGATGEVAQYAKSYAVILLAGSITATGFSSLVRAEGRMRYSTMEWIIPVVTQMVLDPVFIIGFGLGVRGAALGLSLIHI